MFKNRFQKARPRDELEDESVVQEPVHRFKNKSIGDEAKRYDFAAARPHGKKTTVLESVAHLVKSCLGGGVVGIHEAYMGCGLWSALVLNVILGFSVAYCMKMLAKSAHKAYGRTQVPLMSYPDLAEASFDICPFARLQKLSKCFRYLVDVTIVIDLFGSCCCYQVIIARSIKQLVESSQDTATDSGIRIYIGCLLIPCILICLITTLKYLAPFSLIADIFILIVAFSTIVYGAKAAKKPPTKFPIFNNFGGLFEFIGVCVYSMEGIGVTMAIENTLQEPYKIENVLYIGMGIVLGVVMTVGFFGYWGFGEKSKAPVTLNFPWTSVTSMLKVSMALMIYVTFALNFWVPFNLVWHYLKKKHSPERHWLTERLYRTAFVVIITGVSVAFPNVTKLMGVIGSFCLSNMGFIYPACIEILLDWSDPGLGFLKWRLIKFIVILIFGVTLFIVGTYTNVKELITAVYFK